MERKSQLFKAGFPGWLDRNSHPSRGPPVSPAGPQRQWRRAAVPLLTLGWLGYPAKTKQAHLGCDVPRSCIGVGPASGIEAGTAETPLHSRFGTREPGPSNARETHNLQAASKKRPKGKPSFGWGWFFCRLEHSASRVQRRNCHYARNLGFSAPSDSGDFLKEAHLIGSLSNVLGGAIDRRYVLCLAGLNSPGHGKRDVQPQMQWHQVLRVGHKSWA